MKGRNGGALPSAHSTLQQLLLVAPATKQPEIQHASTRLTLKPSDKSTNAPLSDAETSQWPTSPLLEKKHEVKVEAAMEFYGFLIYILSFVFFAGYVVWAFAPVHALQAAGITYFPQKYWAVALPNYFVFCVVYAYGMCFCVHLMMQPAANAIDYTLDDYAKVAKDATAAGNSETFSQATLKNRRSPKSPGIKPLVDVPLWLLNKLQFS